MPFLGTVMGLGDTLRALFSSPSELVFSVDRWVEQQRAAYGSREGIKEKLSQKAKLFAGEFEGLSGTLLSALVRDTPHMIPVRFWGGQLGWRSAKRFGRWLDLLSASGIRTDNSSNGILVRFLIDGTEQVPHPYAPPNWATRNYEQFSQYITPHRDAYDIAVRWKIENSKSLTERLQARLRKFGIRLGAAYFCYEKQDYADIAFLIPPNKNSLLQIRSLWKSESALAELITRFFPDSYREYRAPWLGDQRLDVYVPSIKVAFEYQGEQHFKPIKYFGGQNAFQETKNRDERKATACAKAGVKLIYWKFSEAVSESVLVLKLKQNGIPWSGPSIL
jgi:hypothetical protein